LDVDNRLGKKKTKKISNKVATKATWDYSVSKYYISGKTPLKTTVLFKPTAHISGHTNTKTLYGNAWFTVATV